MKNSGTCTKCGRTTRLHIDHVAANKDTGATQRQPIFQLAVTGDGPDACNGGLEAFVCRQCSPVDFYFETTLRADGKNVREVSVPAQGPHGT